MMVYTIKTLQGDYVLLHDFDGNNFFVKGMPEGFMDSALWQVGRMGKMFLICT
jgi:hypothetical protein